MCVYLITEYFTREEYVIGKRKKTEIRMTDNEITTNCKLTLIYILKFIIYLHVLQILHYLTKLLECRYSKKIIRYVYRNFWRKIIKTVILYLRILRDKTSDNTI